MLIGGTLDEGRAFTSGDIGWTQSDYEDWVDSVFGTNASAVLAPIHGRRSADQFTPAYLTGAILTDAGIIGPANPPDRSRHRRLRHPGADQGHRAPHQGLCVRMGSALWPGHRADPGYANGAGHASELAYLWPNFEENGVRISSLFDPGERQLSDQIVEYWGAFVKAGAPRVAGQPSWPPYTRDFGCAAFAARSRSQPAARQRNHLQRASLLSLEQADRELT